MLLTRGLRLLGAVLTRFRCSRGAFDASPSPPSASLLELRRRRATILLHKGFNKACIEERTRYSGH